MFDNTYEDRLRAWHEFRNSLETIDDPLQRTIEHYQNAPFASTYTNPWDQATWPTPWELVQENQYCDFCKLLGICYSLQLTDKFSKDLFEIHISTDSIDSKTYYLLYIDDFIIGYEQDTYVQKSSLPSTIYSQRIYPMPLLN